MFLRLSFLYLPGSLSHGSIYGHQGEFSQFAETETRQHKKGEEGNLKFKRAVKLHKEPYSEQTFPPFANNAPYTYIRLNANEINNGRCM